MAMRSHDVGSRPIQKRILFALLLLIALACACGSSTADGQVIVLEEPANNAVKTPQTAQTGGGSFDYYVLALSWSPQHCTTPAGRRDMTQCAGPRSYGFILHGLWPQFERGWPQDCASSERLSAKTLQSMLDIMPSEKLIRHEWRKHGTCSEASADVYFARGREAFRSFQPPAAYGSPQQQVYVSPAKYKQAVLAANPQLNAQSVAVVCSGRFLQEVRVCLDKNLQPRACGRDVRDRCSAPEMIVQPLR